MDSVQGSDKDRRSDLRADNPDLRRTLEHIFAQGYEAEMSLTDVPFDEPSQLPGRTARQFASQFLLLKGVYQLDCEKRA